MQGLLQRGTSFCENFSSRRANASRAVHLGPAGLGYDHPNHDMAKVAQISWEGAEKTLNGVLPRKLFQFLFPSRQTRSSSCLELGQSVRTDTCSEQWLLP